MRQNVGFFTAYRRCYFVVTLFCHPILGERRRLLKRRWPRAGGLVFGGVVRCVPIPIISS